MKMNQKAVWCKDCKLFIRSLTAHHDHDLEARNGYIANIRMMLKMKRLAGRKRALRDSR